MFFPKKVKSFPQNITSKNLIKKREILKNFIWSLEPIVKIMGLTGISSPIIDGHFSWFTHFKRAFSFLLVASIQSSLVIHIFLNARNVSNSYIAGISTTALSWNFIIDNLNVAFYTMGGNYFLLMLTRPKTWIKLVKSFKQLEMNLPAPEIYPECRKVGVKSIVYITISVTRDCAIYWSENSM